MAGVERRIVSHPLGREELVAKGIREEVDKLNLLFEEAKQLGLDVELGALNKRALMEAGDQKADVKLVLTKLRLEKDY